MYSNSIYVAATASPKQGDVSATATLPIPLDPSKHYEMSLVYCSFKPEWYVLDDLHLTITNVEKPPAKVPAKATKDEDSMDEDSMDSDELYEETKEDDCRTICINQELTIIENFTGE